MAVLFRVRDNGIMDVVQQRETLLRQNSFFFFKLAGLELKETCPWGTLTQARSRPIVFFRSSNLEKCV